MPSPPLNRAVLPLAVLASLLAHQHLRGQALLVDFSRTDQGGSNPLQAGWQGFVLPATGGEEVSADFRNDELAEPGGTVRVTVAGNSHTRDYASATGVFAARSDLLSDGPLLNRPGIITLSFAGLKDGTYELTSYHHTTQFGASERGPATPFDIVLSDSAGDNVTVAQGLTVSDNSSVELTTHLCEFSVLGDSEVHLDFIRGPDNGPADHFALAGFTLQASGPPPPPLVLGEVLLNEFMASNEDTLTDGDGNSSDWVEIWNSTVEVVSLDGWHLTDDPEELRKWPFPAISLEPDQYLVVFASGQLTADYTDARGHFHTNFRINKAAGGHLALVRPAADNAVAAASEFVAYPRQREDISYGLHGTVAPLETGHFATPTPGGRNHGAAVTGFVSDTRFSHHRGFYERPFQVEITTETPGALIRYTTDGSAPTLTNGITYSGAPGITIRRTTVLRAAAFLEGHDPANVDTQTYLFPAQVPNQPRRPAGFPITWTGWDYAMDQDLAGLRAIVNEPDASEEEAKSIIVGSLKSLPTMSIVMDVGDLFGTATGIYHNTEGRGMAWERPCSVELIDPIEGALMQIDCGIRMQGFTSRNPSRNPKHSLRLAFRKMYGSGKLRYPLFGPDAAREFDTIILRSNAQDAWVYDSTSNRQGQFVRDEWTRRTQLAMGRPSPHGIWVHLYLNGLYWGVYNPVERPDAAFMASYFGGDRDDQDSLKNHEEVIDGNGEAYRDLLTLVQNDPGNWNAGYRDFTRNAPYQALQGNSSDGTPDPRRLAHLDVPNLIDYMIHNMYSAATDWPGNNYIGLDRNTRGTGFKFFSWDNEHGMKPSVTINRTTPHSRDDDSPTKFHHPLRDNAEYRLLFADHLHRAFANDGPLTATNAAARWMEVTGEIEQALIAESARWGDYRRAVPYTVENDFKPLRQSLLDNWFPRRSTIVLGQFRAQGLYPDLVAPGFSRPGGVVSTGRQLQITAPAGTIYHTRDGSDPRLRGGAVNPGARVVAADGIALTTTGTIRARTLHNGEWSALNEALFIVGDPASSANLVLTEIHYNPLGGGTLEFVELMNIADTPIDLTAVRFVAGIKFEFPAGFVLAPDERVLLVDNLAAFEAEYGTGLAIAGEFTGDLDNGGDTLALLAHDGTLIRSFRYDDELPWSPFPDTSGYSLTLITPGRNPDPSDPTNWRASVLPGGSPATSDARSFVGDPTADRDRDRHPAILEYALGSDDLSFDAAPAFEIVRVPGGTWALRYPVDPAAEDVSLTLEFSPDLQNWGTAPPNWPLPGRENLADGRILVTIGILPGAPPKGHVRLRVTLRNRAP